MIIDIITYIIIYMNTYICIYIYICYTLIVLCDILYISCMGAPILCGSVQMKFWLMMVECVMIQHHYSQVFEVRSLLAHKGTLLTLGINRD